MNNLFWLWTCSGRAVRGTGGAPRRRRLLLPHEALPHRRWVRCVASALPRREVGWGGEPVAAARRGQLRCQGWLQTVPMGGRGGSLTCLSQGRELACQSFAIEVNRPALCAALLSLLRPCVAAQVQRPPVARLSLPLQARSSSRAMTLPTSSTSTSAWTRTNRRSRWVDWAKRCGGWAGLSQVVAKLAPAGPLARGAAEKIAVALLGRIPCICNCFLAWMFDAGALPRRWHSSAGTGLHVVAGGPRLLPRPIWPGRSCTCSRTRVNRWSRLGS